MKGSADSSLPVAAQVRKNKHESCVITVVPVYTCPCLFQDSASCGGHSSSGSTSSLSTPPSVSQSPPQSQLNGIASVGSAPAGLGGVTGLMGALGAGSTLGMGGIVGALNGVIQTPVGNSSSHTHATGAAPGVTLPVNNRYVLRAAF